MVLCHTFHLSHLFHNQTLVPKTPKTPTSPSLSLPIIGHLHLLKKPLHRSLAKISNKRGTILFLHFGSRPVLLVSSAAAAEECFTKNDVVFAGRPKLLAGKILGQNYTSLVWASHGPHWRNLRRIASTELLSTHRLQLLAGIRGDEVQSLVGRLFRNCSGDDGFSRVDMKLTFFELTLSIIMRMISGKGYESGSEARKLKEIVRESFEVSGATNIGDFVPALRWVGVNGIEKRLKALSEKRESFVFDLIEEQRKMRGESNSGGGGQLLDVLLSLQENEPDYYTDEIIGGLIQVMVSTATDTSAGTMEWALSLLLNNREALHKAYSEIDLHVGQNRLISESDLSNLPYLQMVIKETLRMYPAGPLLVPHVSLEECTVGGFRVPRDTMLLVNMWAIQNDPKMWVEPTKFRPERFEGSEGEKDYGFLMMPFGSGRRRCPGEGLAQRILGLALGSLIQCFEWERESADVVDMTEGTGLTLPKAKPLVAKCRPRQTMVNLLSQL